VTRPRIPSLDGLRAVSILLVVVGHLRRTRGFGELDLGIGDYAHLGVLVFFVISGFLITSLLRDEYDRNGFVSLRAFYARRALRIFPPAYCYMAVAFLVSRLTGADVWHAVTYTVNFLPSPSAPIVHLWSLSVEEQFYLLWPLVFFRMGPRRASGVALAVLVLGPIARGADRLFLIDTPYHGLPMFPMVADSLAVGCLLAQWRARLELRQLYLALFRPLPSLALVGFIVIVHRYMTTTAGLVLGTSCINIAIAILVHRAMFMRNDLGGRLLNARPVVFVGLMSYSLYLWQQIFINREGTLSMNAFPQNVVCTIGAALASYFLVERASAYWRKRQWG
jgi:peptidoglycan/LPS O-acetylase OafA/YrhL